ncbi:MAG: hypothetical protein BWY14_01282 [Parcubacteria group bacterium ADurb.Bin192]|mgnify:CR=1 FL=1|nr:MAG: hypothetical protein BWY14_01282 [Parcubacteria group bacterium ADurb.Bin192]
MNLLNIFKTDKSKIKGELTFKVRDKWGRTKQLWQENWLGKLIRKTLGVDLQGISFLGRWTDQLVFNNLVVNAGLAGMASRCNGSGGEAAFTYLAVGIGTTAPAAGNTALETEITDSGLARASATVSRVTTTVSNDTAQLDKTWNVTGTKAVTEAGAFNAASSGTLLGRQTFSAVNVANGDTLQVIYKFQMS